MTDPNFWSIVSVALALAVTLIGALVALLSYGHHRRQAMRFWEREQRLPDATRLANLKVQLEELREEYSELKDNVFDAQQTIEAAANQRQWMEDAKEEIARLEEDKKEVARVQNELETTQTQLASLIEQKSGLEGEIANRKSQVDELDAKSAELRKDLANLEIEVEKANRLRDDIVKLEAAKKEATEEADRLSRAASELRNRLETELAALRHERDGLEREVSDLGKEIANRNQEQANLDSQLKTLRENLDGLGSKERELKGQLAELETQADKARSVAKDLAQLEHQKKAAKQDADSLASKLDELKRQKAQSEDEAKRLSKSLDDLKKQQSDLEAERRKLKSEVEKLESKSNALSAQIPTMQSMFDTLSSSVAAHDGVTKPEDNEIWQPVLPAYQATTGDRRGEQECLEDLAGSLRSLGLKFDNRTLYAFHTSLKTTDSSPLVTLAGVSGTGKSELPRRYAEATGMNFLNVAVQPRWDSPQDLFGFYDYLERRFRPTDLTRALIQMDPFGEETGRGWNAPKDYQKSRLPKQMLLVLLDEMNLARIEYYFSEFLSRLETRRGIKSHDAANRKLAEIPLDVGGRRSGDPPMQLFVDKNVLFVGTMNEDETTQALSDKVIDRANVLRFGSPNSIVPVPASQRNGRIMETRPRLTREIWQGWCHSADSLADDERTRLLGWVGEMRHAMDAVNRPFAYRVAHSILEYSANYPDIDRKLDFVIADQIEQKILPKLMGLNPQDPNVQKAIATINKILNEVDDDVLQNKINECSQDDYFQWSGIDRSEV